MKITARTCLAILRRFDVANDENIPRQIERIEVSNPSSINTLATFRFNKQPYAILFDDTAEDDIQYVEIQMMRAMPGTDGKLLENPRHVGSYGVPYEGKDTYLYELDNAIKRLDTHLANTYPDYSRSSWQKQIKAGYVSVNGEVITSTKHDVSDDDEITVALPDRPTHDEKNLPIVYIDESCVVIDKPAGVLTHAKNELDDEFTVETFLARYNEDDLSEQRHGVVHRLDRDTSGVMVGARTLASYEHLKAAFADRKVRKTYIALIKGELNQPEFIIDLPIARHPSKPGSFRIDQKGKSAQTKVTVLEEANGYSLLQLQPATGRTHQLRVHLAHLGHPIVGDRLYGSSDDRLYLHAHKLTLTTLDGIRHEFSSPVPSEFNARIFDGE